MFEVELAVPFGAGLVAAVNPCGFAMLPAYLAYFLGIGNPTRSTDSGRNILRGNAGSTAVTHTADHSTDSGRNILRGLLVGLTLTAGFVAFFGVIGALTSSLIATSTIADRGPWITLVVSGLMVVLGIAMLSGFEPKLSIPRLSRGGDSRGLTSMFLFGVSYAVVSLGCASPVFFGSVSGSFSADGWWEGTLRFLAYALGMGLVITLLTITVALGRSGITTHMRRLLPHINRISGGFLVVAGVVLGFYGWWEVQVLLQDDIDANNPLAQASTLVSTRLESWIVDVGGTRFGLAIAILLLVALLRFLRHSIPQPWHLAAQVVVAAGYALSEAIQYRGNLLVLPILRTVAGIPERVGHWFTDPWRWPVFWEVLAAVIVALVLWVRLRPRRDRESTTTPSSEGAASQVGT
ncbi:cytochrome c biogenesis CcdA family protein [Candidatus Poriferisocius sp.]|uniref:cytochrome c biogenesis CcdA family protein n=1 Tax=Candidatus Poriferisocius sp. TaxID=3101276 RepID=UPI003B012D8F